ncbi:MAG: tRNA (adenosine(37)-N6)-threonylcarbamoyltransferase complex transferase subunit TsaD, partial [Candidatus Omnitrophota bacterium]
MNLVLGIETSCDETSCAVVERGRKILSHLVSSSLEFHKKFGGIIPEAASRYHLEYIIPLLDATLKKAGVEFK